MATVSDLPLVSSGLTLGWQGLSLLGPLPEVPKPPQPLATSGEAQALPSSSVSSELDFARLGEVKPCHRSARFKLVVIGRWPLLWSMISQGQGRRRKKEEKKNQNL